MAGRVLLPRDDAIAWWRTRRRRWWSAAALTVVAAGLLVVLAVRSAQLEATEPTVVAVATEELDGGRAVVTWREAVEGGDAVVWTVVVGNDENRVAVGDEVELVHPPGRPGEAEPRQGYDLVVAAVGFTLLALGGIALGAVYRPMGRQLALAATDGGEPVDVSFSTRNGRWVLLGRWPGDRRSGPGTLALAVGGGSEPLPEGAVGPAWVRGERRPRGVAVVQVGDALVNTYGLVQVRPDDEPDDAGDLGFVS